MLDFRQHDGRACHISSGQLQAREEHFAEDEPVDLAIVVPRQTKALLRVLLGSIEVVPFVEDACQAEVRAVVDRPRLITDQSQDAPIGFGRRTKLDFQLLDLAQAGRSQADVDDAPGRLGE